MAIATNANVEIEINGEIYEVLISRISKIKEKEIVAKVKTASMEMEQLQKNALEVEEEQGNLELTIKAAEAAPVGIEKVMLYKNALLIKAKIAAFKSSVDRLVVASGRFDDEVEEIAKERFGLIVAAGKEELEVAIEKYNITYTEVINELNTAFNEAAKKKSQTSALGQESKESAARSGEA